MSVDLAAAADARALVTASTEDDLVLADQILAEITAKSLAGTRFTSAEHANETARRVASVIAELAAIAAAALDLADEVGGAPHGTARRRMFAKLAGLPGRRE